VTHTLTMPPTDRSMWRRLIAKAHPDAGGDHELFIWVGSVREFVCKSSTTSQASPRPRPEPRTVYEDGRIPFSLGCIFEELTSLALERAGAVDRIYGRTLLLLEDCYQLNHLVHEEQRGASYKRLAYIAHLAGMSKSERIEWYRIAESIPLADRHAGHIIKRLKERAA
jgi:hypothetical protein